MDLAYEGMMLERREGKEKRKIFSSFFRNSPPFKVEIPDVITIVIIKIRR